VATTFNRPSAVAGMSARKTSVMNSNALFIIWISLILKYDFKFIFVLYPPAKPMSTEPHAIYSLNFVTFCRPVIDGFAGLCYTYPKSKGKR
jgi:hypothetical protein